MEFHCPQSVLSLGPLPLFLPRLRSPCGTILSYTLIALSLECSSSLLPISLRWWVTVSFSRDTVLYPPLPWWVVPVPELNDRMAVGASQTLAWFAVPHLGCPPNGGLMRFILDESHQKGSDYVSLPVSSCLLIQHYSCSCSDCTGFHTLKIKTLCDQKITVHNCTPTNLPIDHGRFHAITAANIICTCTQ